MREIVSLFGHYDFHGWQDALEIDGDVDKYHQMVLWIHHNIKNPRDNVVWIYAHKPVFCFRKSKDQVLFLLRWA